ncbi:hypothetical protein LCGC14_1536030 [marine sediment metagenome]|uniref:Uncharacterized protein n=1 Tax=marine sediment metagenome TaxID=412755 RepID=A0A0F9IUK2_9ZZZZ
MNELIRCLYIDVLSRGWVIEKCRTTGDKVIITTSSVVDCYYNEQNPGSYKLICEYTLGHSELKAMCGYEKDGRRDMYRDATHGLARYKGIKLTPAGR